MVDELLRLGAVLRDLALVLLGDADHVRQLRLLELLVLGLELDVRSLQGAVRGGPRAVGLTRGEALAARADDGLCVLRRSLRRPGHLRKPGDGLTVGTLARALLRLTLGLLGEEIVIEGGDVSRVREVRHGRPPGGDDVGIVQDVWGPGRLGRLHGGEAILQRRPGLPLRGPAARGHLLGSAARGLLVNLELLRGALESGRGDVRSLAHRLRLSPGLAFF
mmetsp:Transcript_3436/g.14018  ORF Transcript_3436/g.14018 Transcript_3436/m.14018 type:complete len:220 (-) Transcript_3436:465-1124(-)